MGTLMAMLNLFPHHPAGPSQFALLIHLEIGYEGPCRRIRVTTSRLPRE